MEAAGGVVFFSISYFYVDFLRVTPGEGWVQKGRRFDVFVKKPIFKLPLSVAPYLSNFQYLMLKININTTKVNCACFLFVFPREMFVQMSVQMF